MRGRKGGKKKNSGIGRDNSGKKGERGEWGKRWKILRRSRARKGKLGLVKGMGVEKRSKIFISRNP